jgi:hypothetical protein
VAFSLAIGCAAIVLTRLPQLLGENLYLDGDEAILGLMAKHVSEGRAWPVFFYGQAYGLSIVEAGTGALLFALLGVSDLALRIGMLALWSVGWIGFVLTLRRLDATRETSAFAALLLLCPAWGTWSLLARGGYVTAFALTHLLLWALVALQRERSAKPHALLWMGVGLALLALAQPLWLLAFGPFLAVLVWEHRRPADLGALAAGVALTLGAVSVATAGAHSSAWSPDLFRDRDILAALRLLPARVGVALGGSYFYGQRAETGPFTALAAATWGAALLFALLRPAWSAWRREMVPLQGACAASIALVLGFSLFVDVDAFQYRYLLPVASVLVFSVCIELGRAWTSTRRLRLVAGAAALLLGTTGVGALFEQGERGRFKQHAPGPTSLRADTDALLEALASNGVKHVYCLHPTFQWNLRFYSGEQVTVRWLDPGDRLPELPRAVDRALRDGKKVAIVGWARQIEWLQQRLARAGIPAVELHRAGHRLFWISDPSPALIRAAGFRSSSP